MFQEKRPSEQKELQTDSCDESTCPVAEVPRKVFESETSNLDAFEDNRIDETLPSHVLPLTPPPKHSKSSNNIDNVSKMGVKNDQRPITRFDINLIRATSKVYQGGYICDKLRCQYPLVSAQTDLMFSFKLFPLTIFFGQKITKVWTKLVSSKYHKSSIKL